MSEHGAQTLETNAAHGHDADLSALKFEKSELEDFVTEDQDCGRAIGKLLAATFCVLVVLMSGVAIWMTKHQSVGHDALDFLSESAATSAH